MSGNQTDTQHLDESSLEEMEVREEEVGPPRIPQPRGYGGWEQDEPKSKRNLIIAGGAAGLVLLLLVIWGWRASSARDDARARAAALAKEKKQLEDALELHRTGKRELDSKLTTCKEERENETKRATKLETTLTVCQTAKSDLTQQAAEVKRRLHALDVLAGRFRKMVDTGDLKVKIRRGQMVLQLPSAVLFPSGKAELSKRGTATLTRVAKILKSEPRRRFTVAGHTDKIPVSKDSPFASNWHLSAARAVTVTEQLIKDGVKASNLVAAGYGPYAPVASNRTKRGRLLNRRIEIIVEPDLAKLPPAALKTKAKGKKAPAKGKKGKKAK